MAQVTVELRKLLQTDFKLFDFPYEIDDAGWKEKLERDIVNHYYFYEIGCETPDRFKHQFMSKMLEIMPYYNKLHNSEVMITDPLVNRKLSEIITEIESSSTVNDNSKTQGITSESTTQDKGSDSTITDGEDISQRSEYPQSATYTSDIPTERTGNTTDVTTTATYGRGSDANGSQNLNESIESTTENTGTKNYEKILEGFEGSSQAELLEKYRASLLRLNTRIIQELKPLFILIY